MDCSVLAVGKFIEGKGSSVFGDETCSEAHTHNGSLNEHHITAAQTFDDPSAVIPIAKWNSVFYNFSQEEFFNGNQSIYRLRIS